MESLIALIFFISLNLVLFLNYKFLSNINGVYDIPDKKRKIHSRPVPLIGGLILYINILVFIIINYFLDVKILNIFTDTAQLLSFLVIITSFFILGRIDDKKDLNSLLKFSIMTIFLIASIILDKELLIKNLNISFIDKSLYLGNFSYFFTILCFLLFINAFNMLDGINGQAATYTALIFLILIFRDIFPMFLTLLTFILVVYIFYNLKNLMFLGDSGSLIIGFLISYICIKAYNRGYIIYPDEIYLIMFIPGYELLRLFIKRISLRRNPFTADRNHMHHYLLKKFSLLNTFLIMQILFFSPIFSFLIIKNTYISVFISLLFYLLLLILLTKKNNFIK